MAPAGGAARPAAPAAAAPTPGFDARVALRNCQILLAQQEWGRARMALQELVSNVPSTTTYHAMLAYARGREAAAAGRTQDALQEYQRALELNPSMTEANQAAAELQRRR
jgi:tetratricopeptide (TPR) repeat protein